MWIFIFMSKGAEAAGISRFANKLGQKFVKLARFYLGMLSNKIKRALMVETAREALKASSDGQRVGKPFDSKRLSPGGPNPFHQ
ncbi:hypothetical protein FEM48_Zijuj12G0111000 [Ziziphus jujuba var. spinosa]|uniref:Uncharacterized protein n=1 Tax=Ziziphus jujuba var. spinosa TaxID=714518 RepID=A0A978UCY4_ZIZJJ|nr:hypothetical protein FEM48_Zijuj12G0111000 [Ziziphus jujuba var. spinosa]